MRNVLTSLVVAAGMLLSPPALAPKAPDFHILPEFRTVGYAQDRCCNTGCIAKVVRGKKALVATKITDQGIVSVFFNENGSVLSSEGRLKIRNFLDQVTDDAGLTIVGYTDGCGTMSFNNKLAMRRSGVVRDYLRSLGKKNSVKMISAGEVSNNHNPDSRRVDLGMSRSFKLYEPPPKIIADVYLIDSSGSMQNGSWEMYRRAISYHAPNHAKIYLATEVCVPNGRNFDYVNPAGGTEIWFAYWSVLDKMKPGQTLAIISDFDSTYPLTSREDAMIRRKVKQKGVKVRAIKVR